jgi:hypothetical protein
MGTVTVLGKYPLASLLEKGVQMHMAARLEPPGWCGGRVPPMAEPQNSALPPSLPHHCVFSFIFHQMLSW